MAGEKALLRKPLPKGRGLFCRLPRRAAGRQVCWPASGFQALRQVRRASGLVQGNAQKQPFSHIPIQVLLSFLPALSPHAAHLAVSTMPDTLNAMHLPAPQPRTAIVTGAGSGIGRAVALALLADGWQVALAGRRPQPLEQTASDSGAPARALALPTNVADPQAVQRLFAHTAAHFGRIDLLFNNAGIFAPAAPLQALPAEQWLETVDVNLNGMFWCLQAAFRAMAAQNPQGGRIINNGSISAHAPRPHSVAYTATKHAITGLTKAAALDGRALNIAVGQIDIGNAATSMTQPMSGGILQANGQLMAEPVIDVALVAQSVLHMARLPLSANVLFHTIMATGMPFVGRG